MQRYLSIILILLLALPSLAFGANHYVLESATGGANGTNWTDAWTDLPTSFVRGDTYYVGDGAYGGHVFTDNEQGTDVIYVKKASPSVHGTETGWSSNYGDGQAVFAGTFTFQDDYYDIDGVYRNADWTTGYGFKVDFSGGSGLYIDAQYVSNISVKYIEVEGPVLGGSTCTRAVEFMYGYHDNIYIGYNYFWYINGATVSIGGTGQSGESSGAIIEYNYVGVNESNVDCHGEAFAPSSDDWLTIRYNKIVDTEGSGIIFFLSRGSGNRSLIENISIYGNLVIGYHGDVDNGFVVVSNGQVARNLKVYNNTIVGLNDGTTSVVSVVKLRDTISSYAGTQLHRNVYVYNNLWFDSRAAGLWCEDQAYCAGDMVSTHNYYRSNLSHYADDSNEESYADTNDSIFTDYASNDLTLTEATDAGFTTDLNNTDLLGNTRGADGTWDRGAYEFESGEVPATHNLGTFSGSGSIQ